MYNKEPLNWAHSLEFKLDNYAHDEIIPDFTNYEITQILIQRPAIEKLEWTSFKIENISAYRVFLDFGLNAIACRPQLLAPIMLLRGSRILFKIENPVPNINYMIHLYGLEHHNSRRYG